jgi:hypothetical protein
MEYPWPWPVVVVAEVAVGSFPQDDPIKTIQAQQGPHKALLGRAKAAVMEPEVVVEVVDKMAVQEVQLLVAMTVLFPVKMAIVWHPEVV